MSTNLEFRERESQRKEKVGGRPAMLNGEKSDKEPEREIKKKGDIFCWKNNTKILKGR